MPQNFKIIILMSYSFKTEEKSKKSEYRKERMIYSGGKNLLTQILLYCFDCMVQQLFSCDLQQSAQD